VPTVLGGAVEKIQLLLAEAYAAKGHEVTLISRQFGDLSSDEIVAKVHHIRIPSFNRSRNHLANFIHDMTYSWRVSRVVPAADITITNGFSLPWFMPKRAGRIYIHVARFPKKHLLLYRNADRFQAVSSAVAKAIVYQTPSLAKKVVVIGNPLSLRYFTDQNKATAILYVGRIAREKGIHKLVQAFADIVEEGRCASHWKLRIVGPHAFEHGGDGQAYLDELIQTAQPLGDRCQFVGPVFDEPALINEYAAAAIFVYPSLASKGESFGLAPLEAMASGCAVIVSKLACFDDFVQHEQNALQVDLTQAGSVEQLAIQLSRLMENQSMREILGAAARKEAQEFGLPMIAEKMLCDFEKLCAAKSFLTQAS
jgi:glycosyltransferase involved in cell wall biosynthesis